MSSSLLAACDLSFELDILGEFALRRKTGHSGRAAKVIRCVVNSDRDALPLNFVIAAVSECLQLIFDYTLNAAFGALLAELQRSGLLAPGSIERSEAMTGW